MKRRFLLTGLAVVAAWSAFEMKNTARGENLPLSSGQYLPGLDLTLTPESDRSLNVLIIGTGPHKPGYFMLPELKPQARGADEHFREIEKEFFSLDFELCHGAIMRHLPERTEVFVSVPDPKVLKESLGGEDAMFRHYLEKHCGWSKKRLDAKIKFFKTPASLIWSQDTGEPLGYDSKGRLVIGVGTGGIQDYKESLQALVKAYPKRFKVVPMGDYISTEGGDENLVRLPDGKLGFMIGHHRLLDYLEKLDDKPYDNTPVEEARLKEGEAVFSKALFGLPVYVLPRGALRDPSQASPELFHLDMMAAVLFRARKPYAFVPEFAYKDEPSPLGEALEPAAIDLIQKEYDMLAGELKGMGYPVYRVPFADHPVRSPVNICRFRDPENNNKVVMLGKYPYHLLSSGKDTARSRVARLLMRLKDQANAWYRAGREEADPRFLSDINEIWKELMDVEAQPNPIFEDQARVYRDAGFEVVEVPMFAWGAGGLHCQTLH